MNVPVSITESIEELARSFHSSINEPFQRDDPVLECGSSILNLDTDPENVLKIAHSRLYEFPFKDVPQCWRRLYCEASLWKTYMLLQKHVPEEGTISALHDDLVQMIHTLDMCLIMTNAPGRYDLVQGYIGKLSNVLISLPKPWTGNDDSLRVKRRKLDHLPSLPLEFRQSDSLGFPSLRHGIRQVKNYSLPAFQSFLIRSNKENKLNGPLPLIIKDGASHWPAIADGLWKKPSYLLTRTSEGNRLVPVEVGRSYTDDGWAQRIMPFKDFLHQYMLDDPKEKGYLAQHDLFLQIPKLKDDIYVPDYCYSEPPAPTPPENGSLQGERVTSEADSPDEAGDAASSMDPLLNIWMGSAHTISPAHTDPHHNILVQAVGHKYVRLFAPSETPKMHPQGSVDGIDMSNTTQVDVALAMRLFEGWKRWDQNEPQIEKDPCECDDDIETLQEDFKIEFPGFMDASFFEGVISPGDCLYIPRGWWHYVHSLSPSISVSFWWD
jgi:Cupin-like domain